jgi:hypothetical protein
MEEFLKSIGNYGFPIAITAYLLLRFEKKIDILNDSIKGRGGLLDKIDDLSKAILKNGGSK